MEPQTNHAPPPEEEIYYYRNSFYRGILELTKKLFML